MLQDIIRLGLITQTIIISQPEGNAIPIREVVAVVPKTIQVVPIIMVEERLLIEEAEEDSITVILEGTRLMFLKGIKRTF